MRNRKLTALVAVLFIGSTLSACSQSSDSYGDACPILMVNSLKMASAISSVPTAADYDTRKESLQNVLASVGATSLQELKMNWNADVNSVLGFSGSLKPPTGAKLALLEELRTNVWDWDWTTVSDTKEVEAIMGGFADIDESCGK
jgi:hypothetical protein